MNAPTLTLSLTLAYVVSATIAALPLIFSVIVTVPIDSIFFGLFISIGLISFFLCFLIKTSRKWADEYYEKHKLRAIEKFRIDVLIQTGVIGILAVLPTIGMFFEGNALLTYYYGTLICVPAFLTCIFTICIDDDQDSLTNVYKHRYLIFVWLLFIPSLFMVSFYKAESYLPRGLHFLYRLCHVALSILSAASSLEFLMAWFTDTDELLKGNRKVANGEVEVEEVVNENEPKIKCNVCYIGYSNFQNIPRILRECGHTICENCANQLLNHHNREYLMCPICQMITVVNGSAYMLKKNQAVLDVVEDLRKQKS